jgi:glycosyltransferase involved in cell wall biosynthesis/ADP-heptose:LPS heptosyltransferase
MRIIIDMQGAQTESRLRGIGRYSLSLAQAIVRNRGEHEVLLALSALFPDTIEPIRAAFDGHLPQENIQVWAAPGPTRETGPENQLRREMAERIREAFLAGLKPDMVLITSLFEGFGDDAVSSVGTLDIPIPTAVILYDLIPLINPDIHFRTSELRQEWYARKIACLKRSELLLAISESARQEALQGLGSAAENVVTISGACDASFRPLEIPESQKNALFRKMGITRPFVLYTGGADERKNLHRLIEAFARLPLDVRRRHQLLFVGKMPETSVADYLQTARSFDLQEDELVVKGYVEDSELVALYNTCALFVFPSTHEGFGLPPLEAMSCGAIAIVADAASLPEVISLPEALFDPLSVASISGRMEQALTDSAYRDRLAAYAKRQAATFSWDESAKRALAAMRRFVPARKAKAFSNPGLRLERTSIFKPKAQKILALKLDHMGDLLLAAPSFAKLKARYPHARIDVIVGSWNADVARQLGFFSNIYELDYFKKASAVVPAATTAEIDSLVARLEEYDVAIDFRRQADTRFILAKVPARMKVGYECFDPAIDGALDVKLEGWGDVPFQATPLNRTHISVQMLRLVDALPADANDYVSLPALASSSARRHAGIGVFPTAGNDVKEWAPQDYIDLAQRLASDKAVEVVNVYLASQQEARKFAFKANAKLKVHCGLPFAELVASVSGNRVCVANNSFGAHIASYCGCTVIGVYGGHETASEWGPAFGDGYAIHTDAFCSPCHIAQRSDCAYAMNCLTSIGTDDVLRAVMTAFHGAGDSGDAERIALEQAFNAQASTVVETLVNSLAAIGLASLDSNDRMALAQSIALNHRVNAPARQLLLDISELVQHDARSGIQRVVRAVLGEFLQNPPEGFVVEPVYATTDRRGYRYARSFRSRFLGIPSSWSEDAPVEAWPGDIFFGLDLHLVGVVAQRAQLEAWHRRGVKVQFLVHDLLPVMKPAFFDEGTPSAFQKWLETISSFDGVVCVSRTTADEMGEWLQTFGPHRQRPFALNWVHNGADIERSTPSTGLPPNAKDVLGHIAALPSFLMVGTLEPRKGHTQALAAAERLWDEGFKVVLVIVGKQGWKVEGLAEKLRSHPQLGKGLHWLEGVSDEYLDELYKASSCLLMPSEGEGFGLPLIEAARRQRPILARELPVFREVAGDAAYFFPDSKSPEVLAGAMRQWLQLYAVSAHPRSDNISWSTWQASACRMFAAISGTTSYRSWMPDGVHRFWGADPRLNSWVGLRREKEMSTTGRAGHLIFGPYLALPAGSYIIKLRGTVVAGTGNEWLDVVVDQGRQQLLRHDLQPLEPGTWKLQLHVLVNEAVSDFEVRLWVHEDTDMVLSGLEIAADAMSESLDNPSAAVLESVTD